MSTETELVSLVLAPTSGNGKEILTGTGTTEDVNTTAFSVGRYATIVAGDVALRVAWNSSSSSTNQVTADDLYIPAGGSRDWVVASDSTYVHIEAADGSSAYDAVVWHSGK